MLGRRLSHSSEEESKSRGLTKLELRQMSNSKERRVSRELSQDSQASGHQASFGFDESNDQERMRRRLQMGEDDWKTSPTNAQSQQVSCMTWFTNLFQI
jgi:hypothetical protein